MPNWDCCNGPWQGTLALDGLEAAEFPRPERRSAPGDIAKRMLSGMSRTPANRSAEASVAGRSVPRRLRGVQTVASGDTGAASFSAATGKCCSASAGWLSTLWAIVSPSGPSKVCLTAIIASLAMKRRPASLALSAAGSRRRQQSPWRNRAKATRAARIDDAAWRVLRDHVEGGIRTGRPAHPPRRHDLRLL